MDMCGSLKLVTASYNNRVHGSLNFGNVIDQDKIPACFNWNCDSSLYEEFLAANRIGFRTGVRKNSAARSATKIAPTVCLSSLFSLDVVVSVERIWMIQDST